jgi:hypothetical protein
MFIAMTSVDYIAYVFKLKEASLKSKIPTYYSEIVAPEKHESYFNSMKLTSYF